MRTGSSIIDLIMSLGILALLFSGIYMVYFSVLDAVVNIEARNAASAVLNQEVEIIRNLPYDSVGTVAGVPSGVLPQEKNSTYGNRTFLVKTTVRNIDDPFDGTIGGAPNDTAPADYKLGSLEIDCPLCVRFVPLYFTTTLAPKNLESASSNGSLFVNVFDASGAPVAGASVHLANASVTPSIDLTDITNASGVLQLVGVPTSTQRYALTISKDDYSSDQTYLPGAAGNPNPLLPHATVVAGTLTTISFAIDRTSDLTVRATDYLCAPLAGRTVTVTGEKLVGTSPDVIKFSTSTATDASGLASFPGLEWDTYALGISASGYDIRGTNPFAPLTVNPSTTVDFRYVLSTAAPDALAVAVRNAATGLAVPGATVTITRAGTSVAGVSGEAAIGHTTWQGGAYTAQSGQIDVDSVPGSLRLTANASGTYPATTEWLESSTFDLGGTSTVFAAFRWSGGVPMAAGADAVQFQIAGNTDNATWSFAGPDGTAGTYYAATSTVPHASLAGKRYVRYRTHLKTADTAVTPTVDDVALDFSGNCVPPAYVYFPGLAAGTYSVVVDASGYAQGTTTISVAGAYQSTTVSLVP